MTPVLRFSLSLAALVIAAMVGGSLWPTVPGLVGVLLGLLALLSLGLALATVAFMVDRWDTASAVQRWGSVIICALFPGFGVKVLKALWSHRSD